MTKNVVRDHFDVVVDRVALSGKIGFSAFGTKYTPLEVLIAPHFDLKEIQFDHSTVLEIYCCMEFMFFYGERAHHFDRCVTRRAIEYFARAPTHLTPPEMRSKKNPRIHISTQKSSKIEQKCGVCSKVFYLVFEIKTFRALLLIRLFAKMYGSQCITINYL